MMSEREINQESNQESNAPSFEKILARAAALQGAAEPFYRFSGPSDSPLQGIDLLSERWLAVFPQGEVTRCDKTLTAQQMPALWVNYKTEQLLLLRAVAYQKIVGEDAAGQTQALSPDELAQGEVWLPRIGGRASGATGGDEALSARDLFKQALWTHRQVFAEGALATLVLGLLGLLTSLFTMQVYDRVIPLKGYATLWVLTSGVLVAMVFEFLMRHVRTLMFERACKAIDLDIATRLFNKALSIRLDARPKTVGTFASQLRNFESIRSFLTATTLVVFADVPLALIFILVVALLAGPVALVPLLLSLIHI
jgi:ATP-binding cassette subfamily C protein LapB